MPQQNEPIYCSQQINIPPELPDILKQFTKAAIRTQPPDVLQWAYAWVFTFICVAMQINFGLVILRVFGSIWLSLLKPQTLSAVVLSGSIICNEWLKMSKVIINEQSSRIKNWNGKLWCKRRSTVYDIGSLKLSVIKFRLLNELSWFHSWVCCFFGLFSGGGEWLQTFKSLQLQPPNLEVGNNWKMNEKKPWDLHRPQSLIFTVLKLLNKENNCNVH